MLLSRQREGWQRTDSISDGPKHRLSVTLCIYFLEIEDGNSGLHFSLKSCFAARTPTSALPRSPY